MQHRRSNYFHQLENQGINPVGESRQVQSTCTQTERACTERYKGVVNPFKIDCKVRSEGGKCNEVKSVRLKIWCGVDPGAIVFTRGFSQNSKYYGG